MEGGIRDAGTGGIEDYSAQCCGFRRLPEALRYETENKNSGTHAIRQGSDHRSRSHALTLCD